MRLLRIFLMNDGDMGLSYVHARKDGTTLINGSPMEIYFMQSGGNVPEKPKGLLLVVSKKLDLTRGNFIAFDYNEPIFYLKGSGSIVTADVVKSGFLSIGQEVFNWRPIKTAILTISDKGSRGERQDRSGPALEKLLPELGCLIYDRAIVPDDIMEITKKIRQWTEDGCHLILTTGGTGLAPRDVTPEALLSLGGRLVPGFGEMMRLNTAGHKATAILSRGLAIALSQTLLLALPGSEQGAIECFLSVANVIRHSIETLCGWTSECGGHHH
ncbi:MAG: MogA/MoaB family molybdenum cofactor biosynthesis protein [Synergistaceae bacterium]|nr:MogA/MoaB family molybdenum cofactor biosynthesis protein [Synergistaceae bacterium]